MNDTISMNGCAMVPSSALAKIYLIVMIFAVIIAAVGGSAFFLLSEDGSSYDTIKIGVLADLDNTLGRNAWQGAILAAEQINEEGGLLGREVEVIGEDNDVETGQDMVKINSALTRLLTYHNVDFIIGQVDGEAAFSTQDVISEHKRIFFAVAGTQDSLTQRVLDNYDKYKYYFRVGVFNATSIFQGMIDSLLLLNEHTGFTKVGILAEDLGWNEGIRTGITNMLPNIGFELVYHGIFPLGTFDFSSYLAAAEEAGTEVLVPLIMVNGGIPFVKDWYDRQSPTFVCGGILFGANVPESYEWTDGKCEDIVTAGFPVYTGYPLTSHTKATNEAYLDRWGETPLNVGGAAFDIVRFILYDSIKRAKTTETEAVIEALEETSIETTNAKNFIFTPTHDLMMGENPNNPDADFQLVIIFQWQDGELIPVYPKKIMEEAGASYTFPDWLGPWDDL